MASSDRPRRASRTKPSAVASELLRAGTRRALRPSGPPTDEIAVWTSPDGVDRKTASAVIDLAMRVGVALLSTGTTASDVTATVRRLTGAYGLKSVHVDVTYTSVMVSYHRGPDADPVTVMRIVRFRVQDYTRLERLRSLVRSLVREPVSIEEARERFDAVLRAPHPYRRWVVMGAGGVLTAAASVLIGAGPFIAVMAFVTALIITRVQAWLGQAGVAAFFTQCVAAAIPTAVAIGIVALRVNDVAWFSDVSPSLVVAAGIVLLLAGLSVVGVAQDALEGYYVTAGARAFETVVLTLGITVGVGSVMAIGARLGLPLAITSWTMLTDRVWLQMVCAALIAAAFAVSSYSSPRVVAVSALAAVLGWSILAVLERADVGPGSSSAAAAAVIGFFARLSARRLRAGALPVTTAAIVPLLPGRMTYEGISQIVGQPSGLGIANALPTLATAFGIGLGLAAGVSLGGYFAGLILAKRRGRHVAVATGARLPQYPREGAEPVKPGEDGSRPA